MLSGRMKMLPFKTAVNSSLSDTVELDCTGSKTCWLRAYVTVF